jgi:hypothetical protein
MRPKRQLRSSGRSECGAGPVRCAAYRTQREAEQELQEDEAERVSGEPETAHAGVRHVSRSHRNPGVEKRNDQDGGSEPVMESEGGEVRTRGGM